MERHPYHSAIGFILQTFSLSLATIILYFLHYNIFVINNIYPLQILFLHLSGIWWLRRGGAWSRLSWWIPTWARGGLGIFLLKVTERISKEKNEIKFQIFLKKLILACLCHFLGIAANELNDEFMSLLLVFSYFSWWP